MKKFCLLAAVVIGTNWAMSAIAAEEPKYVGVKKCQVCHATDDIGNQYKIWENSLHAKAFETLLGEEAKKIAQGRGIESPPHEAPECLECHVTGYGLDTSRFKFPPVKEDGIHCESCHGPGSEYRKINIMVDREKALANGLIIPTAETCIKCHNERSPKYKPFRFDGFVKMIEHRIPEGYQWEEEEEEDEDLW